MRWVWPVLVLGLCHASAVVTFQILSVLVEPIKAALAVSDTQYSLMQGLAVSIFACALGIPAASIADRGNRRLVVLTGVLVWSAASVICAFAQTAGQLFLGRTLVGLGEAFLYPSALSLIADVAPARRLASAIGAFGCGGPIGAAFALIGGGWLAGHGGDISVSWLQSGTWRIAFMACGATGLLAAVLLLSVREPARRALDALGPRRVEGSLAATLMHLRRYWQLFAGVCGGMLALSYCVFATASWSPTMLVRVHVMSYETAGRITGLAALVGGVVGAWLAGILTDRVEAIGYRDAALRIATGIAGLFLVTMTAAALIHLPDAAALILCGTYALLGMPTVVAATALQQITRPEIRAQVMAIQVLLVNLLAVPLGPFTVAFLTESVLARSSAVGEALACTVGAGSVAAIIALALSRRQFCSARAEMHEL